MNRNITKKGVNVEKWTVFAILMNLAVIETTTGILEYLMLDNWVLSVLGLIRMASIILAIYAVATNNSSIIR